MIHPQVKKKFVAMTSRNGSSTQQQQMDKVMEEYREIFASPTGVPLYWRVKQSINLTQVRRYLMDRSIDARFGRTMRSRGIFKSCCRKGTSGQAHQPVGARLCWYKRRTRPGDSVLTIGHWTRSLFVIGTQSHRLVTFWTSSRGPNISKILTWSLIITWCLSNPSMCGILP